MKTKPKKIFKKESLSYHDKISKDIESKLLIKLEKMVDEKVKNISFEMQKANFKRSRKIKMYKSFSTPLKKSFNSSFGYGKVFNVMKNLFNGKF